ncbi:unnamed protein product [Cuscuta epithymum]|uniref:Formin-like protein n=1 Tax=Cuscuta epithymum TaxID=186058 RepID=A0AAV0CGQ0_9ASTE|nr:unnamed protein product [Cuscuta epithymum]
MPSTAYLFHLLPLFFCFSASVSFEGRRILHQPFVPIDSLPSSSPPVHPPPAPAAPDLPFSPSAQNNIPFFPEVSTPPPPASPAPISSIPANLTSTDAPHALRPRKASKLVAAAVGCVIAAVVVVSIAVALHLLKIRKPSSSESKPERSITSTPFDNGSNNPSGGNLTNLQKLSRPSQRSSEFLYLGTMVNSQGAIELHNPQYSPSSTTTSAATSRKCDSPELQPLPPLIGRSLRHNQENGEAGSFRDEGDEEFYSPRGSLGVGRESSIGTGSASRRAFASAAIEVQKFGGFNYSSSSSSSSSRSGSPERSLSLSISPPVGLSPKGSTPKSPELIAFQTGFAPPPSETPIFGEPSVSRRETQSPSPAGSTSPERDCRRSSCSSSPTSSHVWELNIDSPIPHSPTRTGGPVFDFPPKVNSPVPDSPSPARMSSTVIESPSRINIPSQESPVRISASSHEPYMTPVEAVMESISSLAIQNSSPRPSNNLVMESPIRKGNNITIPSWPPPPPPPPRKQWENPVTANPKPKNPVSEPPVLVSSLRPISMESLISISPIQLPSPSAKPVERNLDMDESSSPEKNGETPKPKLKTLHWDKVRASSDREMVWDQLKSSSFELNEEMIESLFVVNTPSTKYPKEAVRHSTLLSSNQENRVLDPKKSQNIAILLRALNVTTEEVCDALLEGNADTLGTELLESLMKMAPTKEEERKLLAYKDDSPFKLGPAEKFLKTVIDIPFAFKRVDAMLYISNFESETDYLQKSFQTLEAACEELRGSRMFFKLLEAVLKTGNRMNVGTNRGDAHAFKLDTLLKLVDVKGTDGKTTLLHFVVQEIIRSEGVRLSNLCSSELTNVKKAATMDSDVLHSEVLKLSKGIENITEVVERLDKSDSQKFSESMKRFTKMAEEEIVKLQALESVAMSLVKEITEYFHGNSAREEAHPFRIFMVVRDFLVILERVCKEVGAVNERTITGSAHRFPVPVNPMQFPVPVNPMLQPGRQP